MAHCPCVKSCKWVFFEAQSLKFRWSLNCDNTLIRLLDNNSITAIVLLQLGNKSKDVICLNNSTRHLDGINDFSRKR